MTITSPDRTDDALEHFAAALEHLAAAATAVSARLTAIRDTRSRYLAAKTTP